MKTFIYLGVILSILLLSHANAQTTPATQVATALDALQSQALSKIAEDVDNTASAFADAQNINNSLWWNAWFGPALDIAYGAINGLTAWRDRPTKSPTDIRDWFEATVKTANSAKSWYSVFGNFDRLWEDGQNLQLSIDGPAYDSRTRAMLDRANAPGFFYAAYKQSIANDLLGVSGNSSPLAVVRKGTTIDRRAIEVLPTIHQARLKISNQLSLLSSQMQQANLTAAQISQLTTFVNARKAEILAARAAGNQQITYAASLSNGVTTVQRNVSYSLGVIQSLAAWRVTMLNAFADNVSVEITKRLHQLKNFAVELLADELLDRGVEAINVQLDVDAVIAGQAQANNIAKGVASLSFGIALDQTGDTVDETQTYLSNSQEQISLIPQNMMDALPGEVSKLLMLVDDTCAFVQAVAVPSPIISNIAPRILNSQAIGQTQQIIITGTNFTASSLLSFNDGATDYTNRIPAFISANELRYNIGVGPNPATWTVKVVDGSVESPLYTFYSVSSGAQLTGLSIAGPAAVSQNGTAQFTATALFSDGSTQTVTPSWNENSSATSISSSGLLSAGSVSADTVVTVSASYTAGSVTMSANASITVVGPGTGGGSQTTDVIVNGTFENGTTPWGPSGYADVVALSYPHLPGSWYAYIGNANNVSGSLSQNFPIPASATAATLSFYLNVVTSETTTTHKYDTMDVTLGTNTEQFAGTIASFSNLDKGTNTNGSYTLKTYDVMSLLAPYKGQGLNLVFSGTTDNGNPTIFRIDDVHLQITTPTPVTMTGLSISGPSSILQGHLGAYSAQATFSDGSTQPVSPNSWSENSSSASIDSNGYLTAGQVSADTPLTVTASYSFNGVTKQATKQVTIVTTSLPVTFTALAINGPGAASENSSTPYTATAIFSDGSTGGVSPTWSLNSTVASISANGLLTANDVVSDTTIRLSASYTIGGMTRTGSLDVLIVNSTVPPVLSSLTINGPSTVNENSTGLFSATATFADGSTQTVVPTWSSNNAVANLSIFGLLSAGEVAVNTDINVSASLTIGGITRVANQAVTINNVPDTTGPGLFITSPSDNATVNGAILNVTGTASDAGRGNSGISSVIVNGSSATGGTASGSGAANWTAQVTLTPGTNTVAVVARDNLNNSTQQQISVIYVPIDKPTIMSPTSASITGNGATLGGNVIGDSGASITVRGVVLSPNAANVNPQIGGTSVTNFTVTGTVGIFTVSATGLTPGTTYSYAAYATNSIGTSYTGVGTFTTLSNDATLTNLALSAGALAPTFSRGTTSYATSASYATAGLTVTPTTSNAGATVTVNGTPITSGTASGTINLSLGSNTITVVVTAPDGTTTMTYTLGVFRSVVPPGAVDAGFNPNADQRVFCVAVQPDGKIIIGGDFGTIGGVSRNHIARLNADGSLDVSFNPNADNPIFCAAVQPDGKIVIGGIFSTVGGVTRNRIARLNANGTLDTGFNPGTDDYVYGTVLQPDGKIVIAGLFSSVGGGARNSFARLNANGTLDTGFNPNLSQRTGLSASLQADGKIVIGGGFVTVAGVTRNRIARLNADGTLDMGFNPDANNTVSSIAAEPDGKVLIGGSFTMMGGIGRQGIARLNTDGTLDTGFNPDGIGNFGGMVLQADGKIVSAAYFFTTVGGVTGSGLARFNADGVLDSGFNPVGTSAGVRGAAFQADGKIVMVGDFATVGGVARNRVARLSNDPATQSLTVEGTNRVQWLRGGTSPETLQVTFELSTDSGITWIPLGTGTRITGGWELTALNLPSSGQIRARARTTGGYGNGSSGLVETLTTFSGLPVPRIAVEQPVGTSLAIGSASIAYGALTISTSSTAKTFTIRNTGNANLNGLNITIDGPNAATFNLLTLPTAPVSGPTGSTTFTVQFTPTSAGAKNAALHIASNDPATPSSVIALTGTGLTQQETWRQTWFNTTSNTGNAADTAMPQADGITNLMKFASAMDPTKPGTIPGLATLSGSNILFTYVRNKAAVSDGVTFAVEWSDTLSAGSWSTTEVSEGTVDQGATEVVTATFPKGSSGHRYVRLRVVRP